MAKSKAWCSTKADVTVRTVIAGPLDFSYIKQSLNFLFFSFLFSLVGRKSGKCLSTCLSSKCSSEGLSVPRFAKKNCQSTVWQSQFGTASDAVSHGVEILAQVQSFVNRSINNLIEQHISLFLSSDWDGVVRLHLVIFIHAVLVCVVWWPQFRTGYFLNGAIPKFVVPLRYQLHGLLSCPSTLGPNWAFHSPHHITPLYPLIASLS